VGAKPNQPFQVSFNASLNVDFQGSRVTSDGGLVLVREFDECFGVVLDVDSTDFPVYGQQEHSAYNGHFESTCNRPLLLFNRGGDCLAANLLPANGSVERDIGELPAHPVGRPSHKPVV